MNRRDGGDQSRFAAEEPLFDDPTKVAVPESDIELTDEQLVAKKKKKMIVFGGLVLGVAVVLLIVLSQIAPQTSSQPEATSSSDALPVAERTNLQARIDSLRSDFRLADPSKQPLLFPPLNYQLGIVTSDLDAFASVKVRQ